MVGAILVVYNLSWCMFSGSIRDWINSSRRLLRLHFSLPTLASISQVASIVLIEPADSILHQLHLHHHQSSYRSPKYLVTNLVMNLVTNLVITSFGDEFGDKFITQFSESLNLVTNLAINLMIILVTYCIW